jgi:hypothetical protein
VEKRRRNVMADSISQLYSSFPPHLRSSTPPSKGRILQTTTAYVNELQGHVRSLLGILAAHHIDVTQHLGTDPSQLVMSPSDGPCAVPFLVSHPVGAKVREGAWRLTFAGSQP